MADAGDTSGLVLERFEDDGVFPNSRLPLLLYRSAVSPADASPEAMEALVAAGGWPPAWRSSIYTFHHYHSTAHEVLGIAAGSARLMLGGPDGTEIAVTAGDVLLLPVGTGHCRLEASDDFLVIGAYPPDQDFDIRREAPTPEMRASMPNVPWPDTDPVSGAAEPLTTQWRRS